MVRQVISTLLVITCSVLFLFPPDIADALPNTGPSSEMKDYIDPSSPPPSLLGGLPKTPGFLSPVPEQHRWDPIPSEIEEFQLWAKIHGYNFQKQDILQATKYIRFDDSPKVKTEKVAVILLIAIVVELGALEGLVVQSAKCVQSKFFGNGEDCAVEYFYFSMTYGAILALIVSLIELSMGALTLPELTLSFLGSEAVSVSVGELALLCAQQLIEIDENLTNMGIAYTESDRNTLADETKGLVLDQYGDASAAAITSINEYAPATNGGVIVLDTSNRARPTYQPTETLRLEMTFIPHETGTFALTPIVVQNMDTQNLPWEYLTVGAGDLDQKFVTAVEYPVGYIQALFPGSDEFFSFGTIISLGTFTQVLEGGRQPTVRLMRDETENSAPYVRFSFAISNNSLTTSGLFVDEDSDPTDILELVIDGEVFPLISGTGDTRDGQPFERTEILSEGTHSVKIRFADLDHAVDETPAKIIRSSSTPAVVTLNPAVSSIDVDDTVFFTVSVTDSGGPIPDREIRMATNQIGLVRDASNNPTFRLTTNSSGMASGTFSPGIPGQHVLVAQDVVSKNFDLAYLDVTGGDPSDWNLTVNWILQSTTADEAVYQCDVIIAYQGGYLDNGTQVEFSANHGTWTHQTVEVNGIGIAENSLTLTSTEANSGDEVFTFYLPEHNQNLTHTTNLRVGPPEALELIREGNLTSDSYSRTYGIVVSPDGSKIGRCFGKDFYLHSSEDFSLIRKVTQPCTDDLQCVSFSPDSQDAVVGDDDGHIAKIDLATGGSQEIWATGDPYPRIQALDWYKPDRIVAVTEDGTSSHNFTPQVYLLNSSLSILNSFSLPGIVNGSEIYRVDCSPTTDQCVLATRFDVSKWFLVSPASGAVLQSGSHPTGDDPDAVALNEAGDRMVVAGESENGYTPWIELYAVGPGGQLTSLADPVSSNIDFVAAEFLHYQGEEVLALAGGNLELFPTEGGQSIRSVENYNLSNTSCSLVGAPDGQVLAGSGDSYQAFYNLSGDSNGPTFSLPSHPSLPYAQTSTTIGGTVDDAAGVNQVNYRLVGGAWIPIMLEGDYFETTIENLAVGDTTVEFEAFDSYSNRSSALLTITRLDDLDAPMINAVMVTPFTGVRGTPFSLTCQAIDLGAGVASVSANIHSGNMNFGTTSFSNQGGDTFGATIDSTNLPFGVFTVDVMAVDSSVHANARTSTNATGFEVVFGGLFGDGFDLGGTSRWSGVVGEGTPTTENEITITLPGGSTMDLVYVPAETFNMGSPTDERGRDPADENLHEVTLTHGYYLGKYEVTQAQWTSVMDSPIPSTCGDHGTGPDYPAYCISWNDICGGTTGADCLADSFIGRLNTYLGTDAFRLPCEAEWERGARADTQTEFSFSVPSDWDVGCGSFPEAMPYMVWCNNSGGVEEVGSKNPNLLNLYDMHGNVWEWVADYYAENLGDTPVVDPHGPATGSHRVKRGGQWNYHADACRSASRGPNTPDVRDSGIGFRIARTK